MTNSHTRNHTDHRNASAECAKSATRPQSGNNVNAILFDQGEPENAVTEERPEVSCNREVGESNSFAGMAVGIWADPAPIIALSFVFGKIAITTGTSFPRPLALLLIEHFKRGDLATEMVLNWLIRSGVKLPQTLLEVDGDAVLIDAEDHAVGGLSDG